MSLLKRKEVDAKMVAGIGITGIAVPNAATAVITSALTTRLGTAGRGGGAVRLNPSNNPEVDGVCVDTARNRVKVTQANGQDLIDTATGRIVYGRITESSGVYTVAFRTWDGTTETAFLVNSTINIKLPYNYFFKDLPDNAFWDAEVFGGTGTGSLVSGSIVGGRGVDVNFSGGTATVLVQPDAATLTDATTVNWDLANNTIGNVTLAGSRIFANPTNKRIDIFTLRITQDATGGRLITSWGSDFKFINNNAPTLSTAANATDVIQFYCDGTFLWEIGRNVQSANVTTPITGGSSAKLISEFTTVSDITNVNFMSLNGNSDKAYEVEIYVPAVNGNTITLNFETDQGTNYRNNGQSANGNGIVLLSGASTTPAYAKVQVSAKTGGRRFVTGVAAYSYNAGTPEAHTLIGGVWLNTTSNITSLQLYSSVILGIPAGAYYRLFALR